MRANTFQTPGVYLKGLETEALPANLSAVTGFVGMTERGSLNQPIPIKSWGEFLDVFGGFVPFSYLAPSVFGFFLNGGQMCYVVRVGGDDFINAEGWLKDKDGNPRLAIVSKIKGKAGSNIRVEADTFTALTALKVPENPDSARNVITVHNIHAFIGAGNEEFTIIHEGTSETIAVERVDTAGNKLVLKQNLQNDFPLDSIITAGNRFNIAVKLGENAEPVEVFYNLGMVEQEKGGVRFFKDVINEDSKYICVDKAGTCESTGSAAPPVGEMELAGGKDPGQLDYRYYTGYQDDSTYFDPTAEQERLGLAALEDISSVSLVAVPDLAWLENETFELAQKHILFHCRKMGNRFALLDSPRDGDTNKLPDFPAKEAKFGALYYPWMYCIIEGDKKTVPPSGFIAGIIARTDSLYGINKAPANVKIKGVVDLESSIDRALQDELNLAGINCIRKFENGTIKIWGARTLSKEPKWRYVNVRRVFLYILKTLPEELQWAVFEPNRPALWRQVESAITSFLNTMVAKGVTAGSNSREAFYVRCNRETNPKGVEQAGQVVAEVGVALAAPAEFIAVTIKKTPESLIIIEEEV